MSDILFSIVIPAYNRAKFIGKAIHSLLDQQGAEYEIIVVDDGSTDDTRTVVSTINNSRLRYLYKTNGERAAARNFGAQQAHGKFVGFLDSDDYVLPGFISTAGKFVSTNPHAAAFHLAYEFRDTQDRLLRTVYQKNSINESILKGNSLGCIGVFVERKLILENPFNEDRKLSTLEDWELWIRLAAKVPFHHVNEVSAVMVQHEERSVMSTDVVRISEKVELFCQLVTSNPTNQIAFGDRLQSTTASARTYAALHIAMAGSKKRSWAYLVRGIRDDLSQLFTKRFVVIILFLLGIRK